MSSRTPVILKAHIALTVQNLAASVEFYGKMLGIAPCKIRPGYAKFDVVSPPLNLSLNSGPRPGRGSLSHMGLQVANTGDVIAIRDRWALAGLAPRNEMQTSCCYALQDKAWVRDPDGNEWEVFTVLADVEQSDNSCCNSTSMPAELIGITQLKT